MKRLLQTAAIAASVLTMAGAHAQSKELIVTHIATSGPLEPFSQQQLNGLRLGLEYATNGTNTVNGVRIVIKERNDQGRPDIARAQVEAAFAEDDANIALGPISSPAALAALSVAEEYERILIPTGVADAVTGSAWNPYIFRIGRNSTQDAIASGLAIGKGACVATIGEETAFGRDGVAAFAEAVEANGSRVVHQEYSPTTTTDHSATIENLFASLRDRTDCPGGKYIFPYWANGATSPMPRIVDAQPERFGIQLTGGGHILPVLVSYANYPGMEGAVYYFFELPDNEINDWFVAEHLKRHNTPPDFFTAQGMNEGIALAAMLERSGGKTDTDSLIAALRGLEFEGPKGAVRIRPEDHQALQSMYHYKIVVAERDDFIADRQMRTVGVPTLVRELKYQEMNVPIRNNR